MQVEAYFALGLTATVLAMMAFSKMAPDVILMSAVALLMVTQVLEPEEALAGFSNPGVITIAILYIVASGLQETGAVHWITGRLFGRPRSLKSAQWRLALPTIGLSAFLNNTAVVAIFIPAVQAWSTRFRLPASKLLLPMSYLAILGGTCTMIGTSTNLVVDGLLRSEKGISLQMFDIAWVGVPVALVGALYLTLFADRLLPVRHGIVEELSTGREYAVEFSVVPSGPLHGQTIAGAGLRSLVHGYLADIERGGIVMAAVPPETQLKSGDKLLFVGAPECADELRRIRGLTAAEGDVLKLNLNHHERILVEAVIGPEFGGLGKSIRESRFRSRYHAVILSVSRSGKRLSGKVGDIRLEVGDTLLMETGQEFVAQYQYRRDFLLVSALNSSAPPDFTKAPWALGILGVMIVVSATGLLSILHAALLAAGAMLAARCMQISKARRSIDLSVLIVIAASFALGVSLTKTGSADQLAQWLIFAEGISPWTALVLVYLATAVLTEMITNNAAAVLMFPVATSVASELDVNFMPFAIAVMFAASASFIIPIGYQTNLMVMGPGGYRLSDYLRLGGPLSLLVATTSLLVIPLVWHF